MILLIDNYDSFSYNLFQMIGAMEPDIRVIRNDAYTVEQIREMNPSGIILSPGPGRPEDAGVCMEIAKKAGEWNCRDQEKPGSADVQKPGSKNPEQASGGIRIPVLGVCLGHQSICAAYGATVGYAKELMHGKTSQCRIDVTSPIFAGLDGTEQVGRYHSLAAVEETMPDCLKITARTQDGEIMAVEHREFPIYGIQFHPESILTPHGKRILENFVNLSR